MTSDFSEIVFLIRRVLGGGFRAAPLVALALCLTAGPAARAQEVQRIAAVVNEDIISAYDLNQRITAVVTFLNIPNTQDNRRQLLSQVLNSMIDETLQLQEADEYEVDLSSDDLEQSFVEFARRNNYTPKEFVDFLEEKDITPRIIMRQLQAEMAWGSLMNGLWGQRVRIGDEEIDNVLQRLEESKGMEEFLVSEIVILAETPAERGRIASDISRLRRQIMQGASFEAVARQFSQGATAAIGGDVGWVRQGQMPREIDAELIKLGYGEVSEPIATPGGYSIVKLQDRRTIPGVSPLRARVDLTRLFFEMPEGAGPEEQAAVRKRLEAYRAETTSCAELTAKSQNDENILVSRLGIAQLGELPADLRDLVYDLQPGQISEAIDGGNGLVALAVCDREDPPVVMPTRDSIESNLRRQRVAMMARRHLRDLRTDAIIDIR